MGMLLLPLAALIAFGAAAAAADTAEAQPGKKKPRSRVRVRTPARPRPTTQRRRVSAKRKRIARRRRKAKALAKKIESINVQALGKRSAAFARRMMAAARKSKNPVVVREAAAKASHRAKPSAAKLAEVRRLMALRAQRERDERARKIAAAQRRKSPAVKRDVAKKVIKAEKTAKPTPDQAAKALRIYTKNGGNQGTKNNPSEVVRKAQEIMGLKADGIIGPVTRRRAKALGSTLYPRSYQKR